MILDTIHKRKSFAITSVLVVAILLLMFLAGMKYLDPPIEKGIDITFGLDSQGMGEIPPSTQSNIPPSEPQPIVEQSQEETPPDQDVVTQDIEEAPIIAEKPKKIKETSPAKQNPEKPKEPEKPKPSSEATNALASILGSPKKTDTKTGVVGQGDDATQGYKGSPDGNPYSNSYYGSGGSGSGGKGWGLNGRSLQGGEKIAQNCNESGRVVVEIVVNQEGRVVKMKAGVRGTTNSHPCLIEAAEKTARTYRWNADDKAPLQQIGFIEINFRLGE